MQLCGDPTCRSVGCSSETVRAWERRQLRETRQFVSDLLAGKVEIEVPPHKVIEQEDID